MPPVVKGSPSRIHVEGQSPCIKKKGIDKVRHSVESIWLYVSLLLSKLLALPMLSRLVPASAPAPAVAPDPSKCAWTGSTRCYAILQRWPGENGQDWADWARNMARLACSRILSWSSNQSKTRRPHSLPLHCVLVPSTTSRITSLRSIIFPVSGGDTAT